MKRKPDRLSAYFVLIAGIVLVATCLLIPFISEFLIDR